MRDRTAERRVSQLVTLLEDIRRLYEELRDVMERKLVGMRHADTDVVMATARRERFLTDRIQERNGLRRQLMELIAESLGEARAAGATMSVSDVASRMHGETAEQLRALALTTRTVMLRVSDLNRIAGVVGKEMQEHFRRVQSAMTAGLRRPGGYSRSGGIEASETLQVFETTG